MVWRWKNWLTMWGKWRGHLYSWLHWYYIHSLSGQILIYFGNIERDVHSIRHHVWEFRNYGLVPIQTKFPLLKKLRTQIYTILSTKTKTSFESLHIHRQHMDEMLRWRIFIWDTSPKILKKIVNNPLQWWRDNQSTYPNLSRMAFDFFAIPAMSSECERAFSKASYTLEQLEPRDYQRRGGTLLMDQRWCCKNERTDW